MRLNDSRRRFVKRLGAVALVGSLAGCGDDGDDETPTDTETGGNGNGNGGTTADTETDTGTATDSPTPTDPPTETPTPTVTPTPPETVEGRVGEYLDFTQNYNGEDDIVDMTGEESVTVAVGEGGNLFEPAAIRISTDTTVTWEWINGFHNVVADPDFYDLLSEDEAFRSGDPVIDPETPFEYTFEEADREWPYYCNPHKGQGMKGYVIVEG